MKKYLCLFIFIIFCFTSACSLYKNISKSDEQIIETGTYYRIYKDDTNQVCYEIYNDKHETVISEKIDRPIEIVVINDDMIDVEVGMGTGVATHQYYSVSRNVLSQKFLYVLTNSDNLIAYVDVPKDNPMKGRKVIVQNIFDKSIYYKEFKLNFSNVDTPVIDAIFSKDGTYLQIIYLSGEEQTQNSTALDLM